MSENTLPTPDRKMGVPRCLLDRSTLEGKTIEDNVQRALLPQRCGGLSYNLASMREKRAVNVETTSENYCVTEIPDKFLHANHYVSEGLKNIMAQPGRHDGTVERYGRGIELISQTTPKSSKKALNILSDAKIFQPLHPETDLYTVCTALFEISDGIVLRLYPHEREKVGYMRFSFEDLA